MCHFSGFLGSTRQRPDQYLEGEGSLTYTAQGKELMVYEGYGSVQG